MIIDAVIGPDLVQNTLKAIACLGATRKFFQQAHFSNLLDIVMFQNHDFPSDLMICSIETRFLNTEPASQISHQAWKNMPILCKECMLFGG